jgi:DNA ligase-1
MFHFWWVFLCGLVGGIRLISGRGIAQSGHSLIDIAHGRGVKKIQKRKGVLMKFKHVAEMFDAIEKESSRTKMTELLADLFGQATPYEASIIAYLSLGSLNPPYIGTLFNFAEKSLLKVIAKLFDVTPATIKKRAQHLGDLGLVVAEGNWAGSSDIVTVHDVEDVLLNFLELSGSGSQDLKETKMFKILRALDPLSAKYIVRIVEGNLRLGFSDMTLLDAFSWMEKGDKSIRSDLEEAYNTSADIGLLIKTLKQEGLAAIKKMKITPGIPIRPAAAERMPDAVAIIKKLGTCVAQPKLDGFRLQIHIDNRHKKPLIRFFSRNLLDMSPMFPDVVKALEDFNVKTAIIEGEAISIDPQTGVFLPFQETVKRKRKHEVDKFAQDFPLKLFLFDALYLDGVSLLDEPHHTRRKKLLEICGDKKIKKHDTIFVIDEHKVSTAEELSDYFEQNVAQGLEGLVVKRPDAIYQPGKRNFNWIKLKRQEGGSLEDTIDCVILGYYHGTGKRAAFGIGALLVGVYNKSKDCFQTVAKIGTGLTDVEWRAQKKSCDEISVKEKPHNVECVKELVPDVWVLPQIVCMIRADEITLSPLHCAGATEHKSGMALRFPRLMGYRPDKSPTAVTTVDELKRLFELQFEKKSKHKRG